MENISIPKVDYINLYIVKPKGVSTPVEIKRIDEVVRKIVTNHLNDGGKVILSIRQEYKELFPMVESIKKEMEENISIKTMELEFNKYKPRIVYQKRDDKAIIRATHVLIFKRVNESLDYGSNYIKEKLEDVLNKYVLICNLPEEGVSCGEEQKGIHRDHSETTK